MKFLFLCFNLVVSTTLFAKEITLSEKNAYAYSEEFQYGDFQINEDLGRAWVNLTFRDNMPEDGFPTERVKVAGLRFDKTSQEIIIEDESGRIVCAYQKRGLFGVKSIRTTGLCVFKSAKFTQQIDDGFEIRKVTIQRVTLSF